MRLQEETVVVDHGKGMFHKHLLGALDAESLAAHVGFLHLLRLHQNGHVARDPRCRRDQLDYHRHLVRHNAAVTVGRGRTVRPHDLGEVNGARGAKRLSDRVAGEVSLGAG